MFLPFCPGCAEARGAGPVRRHVSHLWRAVQAMHGGQRGGDQRAGDVRDRRDLGPGRHQGGGGLLRPKHGGPHSMLLRLPGARMLATTGLYQIHPSLHHCLNSPDIRQQDV